jgi:hypothetical protein
MANIAHLCERNVDGSASDVAKICRDLGLSICAFQPFRDFDCE